MKFVSKNDIIKNINILDIAAEFGIFVEATSSGNFNYRCKCPSPEHKNGNERTGSCYIDSVNNNFWCFGCLPPDAEIRTPTGLVKIKELGKGDEVYTALGSIGKITEHIKKTVDEKIYKFGLANIPNDPLSFTEEHKMLVLKNLEDKLPYLWKHSKTGKIAFLSHRRGRKNIPSLQYEIVKAREVSIGDYFFTPCIEPDLDISEMSNPYIKKYTKGVRTQRINKIPINKDMMWLFGIYCAEGSLYRGGIRFTLNINEIDFLNRIKEILESSFNVKATIGFREERNTGYITCSSTDLNAFFRATFGSGCQNKTAPYFFTRLPLVLQSSFLEGLFDGDGSFDNITLGITSRHLIDLSQQIAINLERPFSLRTKKPYYGGDGILRKEVYTMRFFKRSSKKCFFEEVNGVRSFVQRIDSILIERPLGVVYDMEVEAPSGSNTFLCRDYAVHNCSYGTNIIDFYMACAEIEFGPAMSVLRERVDPEKATTSAAIVVVSNNFTTLLSISKLIRKTMLEHSSDLKWINNLMRKTDQHISDIKTGECQKTKALYAKVTNLIEKRYQ